MDKYRDREQDRQEGDVHGHTLTYVSLYKNQTVPDPVATRFKQPTEERDASEADEGGRADARSSRTGSGRLLISEC